MQRLPIFVVATLLLTSFSTPVADNVPAERLISETSEGSESAGIARWRQAREASMRGRDEASRNAVSAAAESIEDREHDSSQATSSLSALARWRRARNAKRGSADSMDSASGHASTDDGAAGGANARPRVETEATQHDKTKCKRSEAPPPWHQHIMQLQQSILPAISAPHNGASPPAGAADVLYNYPSPESLNVGKR